MTRGIESQLPLATEAQILDAAARQRMLNQRFAKEVFQQLLGGRKSYPESLRTLRQTATSLHGGGEVWLSTTAPVRVPRAPTAELAATFRTQLDLLSAMEKVAATITTRRWWLPIWRSKRIAALSGLCEQFQESANEATVLLSRRLNDLQVTAERKVDAASQKMQEILSLAKANAHETEESARDASAATLKIMSGAHSVAEATEELTASIREISLQARQAAESACTAGEAVQQSNECMMRLGETAEAISDIISLIVAVAERSNLLALNASIEAARAGDVGRGFDVVAQEVKALSIETRAATEKISAQASFIRAGTNDAIATIKSIHVVVEQVKTASAGIAIVVDQQTAAAAEISRSMHEAARAVGLVNDDIAATVKAAEHTSRSAAEGLEMAGEVAERGRTQPAPSLPKVA